MECCRNSVRTTQRLQCCANKDKCMGKKYTEMKTVVVLRDTFFFH